MPVDYSDAGPAEAYPERTGPRGWVLLWLCCNVIGAGAVLLLWSSGQPAQGAGFWFAIVGMPHIAFALLLGWFRQAYESAYLGALFYNQHREERLRELVLRSQVPLEVVASSHCIPGDGMALMQVLASKETLLAFRAVRSGAGLVQHSRLPDWDEQVLRGDDDAEVGAPLDRFDILLDVVLGPIVESVRELQQQGRRYAPVVRLVDGSPELARGRLLQLRHRLDALGLSGLESDLVANSDSSLGLMLADDWLDREAPLPLLLVATQLHEMPPEGSAEAGVALLMMPKNLTLPSGVRSIGRLHRPVACTLRQFGAGCAAALRASLSDAKKVAHLWVAGVAPEVDAAVASGLADADLSDLLDSQRQYHLDRSVGNAGVVSGWLAVAGALETDETAPQLISTQSGQMQLAVVYSYPKDGDQDVTC